MFSHFVVTKVKPSKLDVGAVNMRQTGVEPIDPLVFAASEARNCNAGPQTFSTTFELSETESTSYSFTFGSPVGNGIVPDGRGRQGGWRNQLFRKSIGDQRNHQIENLYVDGTGNDQCIAVHHQLGQLQLAQPRANGTFTMPVTVGDKVEVHYTYRQNSRSP